jgi:hypothetical protein
MTTFAFLLPSIILAGDLRTGPPTVLAPSAPLPKAERIATPSMPTLLGYTRRILHLHDGHALAVLSYAGSAKANWLFLVDSRDLSSKRFEIPNNDIRSHSAALGSDGNIYLMPYGTGRTYRFDVTKGKFDELPPPNVPPGEFTWDAIGSSDGCIYFGTYPNAILGRYDIATKTYTLWPHVLPKATYVSDFEASNGGGIIARAWGESSNWIKLDAKATDPSIVFRRMPTPPPGPPLPPGETEWAKLVTIDNRQFGIATPSSKLYEIIDNKPIARGDSQAPAQAWYLEPVDQAIIGISHFGTCFRFDLATNTFTRAQLDNDAPGANHLMFLEAITPDCVIGGNYSQQNLFALHPTTGALRTTSGYSVRTSGEACCAAGLGGKGYIGIYIHSLLVEYDPTKPFAFGTNPRELANLNREQHQTRPIDMITDGTHVFMTSEGNYSTLGGALAVYTSSTGAVEIYPQLVKDQNLETMAFDPKSGCVWGGTDRWGQMHSVAPTQPTTVVWAFDPRAKKLTTTLAPWPNVDAIRVLGSPADGLILATANGQAALIDTTTQKILYDKPWPIEPIKLRKGKDGATYALSGGILYRWDLTKNELHPVASAPGCTFFTEASPELWLLGDAISIYRMKL